MADPKYANLPGIAHDQPDLYETYDLPEADQNRDNLDDVMPEDSEFIEKLHISAQDAFSKFKGKSVGSNHVDFSDRLGRNRRIGYQTWSGDWELAALGEKETLEQKFERLKLELADLHDNITNLKDKDSNKVQPPLALSRIEGMMRQLEALRLEKLPIGEVTSMSAEDPSYTSQLKQLVSGLEEVVSKDGEGQVSYKVLARPGQAASAVTARIASLEQKVSQLQSLVSTSKGGGGERTLCEVAGEARAMTALLQPSQLDAADARMQALLAKMDLIKERLSAISQPLSPHHQEKISQLQELTKSSGELSGILPQAIERLATLEALHNQVLEFSKSKTELSSMEKTLRGFCDSNKQFLQQIDENFTKSVSILKTRADSLEAKVKALSESKSKK